MLFTLKSCFIFIVVIIAVESTCPWSKAVWEKLENNACWQNAPKGVTFVDPVNCHDSCGPDKFPKFCATDADGDQCKYPMPYQCVEAMWPGDKWVRTVKDMIEKKMDGNEMKA